MRPGIGSDCRTIATFGLGLTLGLVDGGAWLGARADSSRHHDHPAPAQALAVVEFEDAPGFIDLYDPSAPELAVTEVSELPCGAEGTMGLVELIDERGAGGAGGGAVIGLHGVDGADSGAGLVTLDVMILYTSEALDRRGQGVIEESILYGVACANETLRRSNVPVELRLVHHGEAVGHAESGNTGTELSWLMHDLGVNTLRNEFGADLVSLIISRGNYAGMANCSGSYSVFCGNPVVFTHEIGHNFGCSHDRAQPAVCGRDSYSYAHTFKPTGDGCMFGTIMSYVGSVILNFSNPRVRFRGCPTGLPEGHLDDLGRNDSADNARTVTSNAGELAMRKPARVSSLESPGFDASGTRFSFEIIAQARESHSVEYTADFVRWLPLGRFDTDAGKASVVDAVPSVPARFYRVSGSLDSPAQAIGFYRRVVSAGRTLIANQLDHGDNTVGRLLRDLPVGTVLRKWDAGSQEFIDNTRLPSGWSRPEMSLHPGEGAVMECDRSMEIIFVGHVRPAFYQPTELGWSLVSSPVPQAGPITALLAFPAGYAGQIDRIQKSVENSSGSDGWTCRDGMWGPQPEPEVGIGEAFWSHKTLNSYIWKRVLLRLGTPAVDASKVILAVRPGSGSVSSVEVLAALGAVLRIEGSANLTDWTDLGTVTNDFGPCSWTDPEGCASGRRFYRATLISP